MRKGSNCRRYKLDEGDYITEITVKHSHDAIHYLGFKTKSGHMYAIGSDQEYATNEFEWIVTTYTFDEYERW